MKPKILEHIERIHEIGGMTSDPRVMKKEYGDRGETTSNPSGIGDEEIYANFSKQMRTKGINRGEIIKILNQIYNLQQEGAPAIAQRRLEELFEKVGIGTNVIAGVDFSDDLRRLEDL